MTTVSRRPVVCRTVAVCIGFLSCLVSMKRSVEATCSQRGRPSQERFGFAMVTMTMELRRPRPHRQA